MPEITIVGLGPGPLSMLTREAEEALLAADRVLFRTAHPAFDWLRERGREPFCFNLVYATPGISYDQVYGFIVDAVMREAETRGRAVYAVPGHPFMYEHAAQTVVEQANARGYALRVITGVSFVDLVCTELRLDPLSGLQLGNGLDFVDGDPPLTADVGLLIAQLFVRGPLAGIGDDQVLDGVARWLRDRYPPDHRISLVWTGRRPDYSTQSTTVAVKDFRATCAELEAAKLYATAYVPPRGATRAATR